ncbi:MAG: glutamine-hydrolyzing carbamoyl-phosphate synthase small subunit, partial [Salinisphaera sp.]|nr:glutamine-hydrolyzing carbamoyl-phosphate synthase small subunit [Salinisphaera sp.]
MPDPALLALADGSLFHGVAIGAPGVSNGEVVFNTAMTGYQEILTDPSYRRQLVTLTYPHVGNTGVNDEDMECGAIQAAGLILREPPRRASNWRSQGDLYAYLAQAGVVGVADIDTRRLTRLLREGGAQNGAIMAGEVDVEKALRAARAFPGLKGMDLAAEAGTTDAYEWDEGSWGCAKAAPSFRVVVYDYGVKRNILRRLVDHGCAVTVVPPSTPLDEALRPEVDGVVLSNGPGDPDPCAYAIATARELLARRVPTLGICLGHQILGLAVGAKTMKMKFGHHGANHPVLDLDSGRVMISSQNHGFAVDETTLPAGVRATHRSLFDGSLQGLEVSNAP